MKNKLLILLFPFILLACKKEEPTIAQNDPEWSTEAVNPCPDGYDLVITETEEGEVASNEYIAAYPDSWWKFSNGDELSCEWADYTINYLVFTDTSNCEKWIESHQYMLPRITGNYVENNQGGYVYLDALLKSDPENTKIIRQLSTDVGSNWAEQCTYTSWGNGAEWQNCCLTRKVVSIRDSVILPNDSVFYDVIEVDQRYECDSKIGYYSVSNNKLFYAKEIGLIWEIKTHIDWEGTQERYLVDYYIAPH